MQEDRFTFSLQQLMIVLLLLGIVASIGSMSLQQYREKSCLIRCENNLRQIILAAHNYESAHMEFPSGLVVTGQYAYLSTFLSIEPFSDEGGFPWEIASRALDQGVFWYDEVDANSPHPLRKLEWLHCPSMPEPKSIHSPWAPSPVPTHTRADYAICAGYWGNSPGDQPLAGAWAKDYFTAVPQTMGGFTDGTSTTIYAGESLGETADNVRLNCHSYNSYFDGLHINDAYHSDFGWFDIYIHPFKTNDGVVRTTRHQFSSSHPSGVVFAYCDGSVNKLSRRIDLEILAALSTAAENDKVGN